uniref:hypothetical protein n=1 Tax=Mesorhizobium sp. WSM4875 TaxID=3038539 RepID=UPI0024165BD3|nr:hypothetical protein [Mesorhizobium sp. WSM4875]WIE94756.1 hypothetical protein P9270_029945 [Mesorhizobium sp. WSM4875]
MMQMRCVSALALRLAIAALSVALGSGFALAQEATPDAINQRLDRIEQKLDTILRRLDANQASKAAGTGQNNAPGAAADKSAPEQSSNVDTSSYKRGVVAIAYIAPDKADALSEIPADSLGSYVYSGGALPLSELSRNGVVYDGLGAIELQGWLKVTEPGRTQLAVEYRATTGSNVFRSPTCIASIWLEDRPIGSRRAEIPMPAREEKTISMLYGADLQPGLYKLRAWLACTAPRDLRKLDAELLIKTPVDMNLRMIDGSELLHQGS